MTVPKSPYVAQRWFANHQGTGTTDEPTRLRRLRRRIQHSRSAKESAGEFIDLADWVLRGESPARNCVLGDPLARWWLDAAEGLADDAADLQPHLQRFKAIALGVAAAAGSEIRFATPLVERLPLVVIGSPWSLLASPQHPWQTHVELHGIAARRLAVHVDGQTYQVPLSEKAARDCPTVQLHKAAIAQSEGCRITLQPQAFHWSVRTPEAAPAWSREGTGMVAHGTVEQALVALARYHPRSLVWVRDRIRLAALLLGQEPTVGDIAEPAESCCRDVPGTIVLTSFDHPLMLAERLVRHVALERFSTSPTPSIEAQISVCRFWLEAVLSDELEPEPRAYAVSRLRRIPRQLSLTWNWLSDRTNSAGLPTSVLKGLDEKVVALKRSIAWLSLPADPAVWEFREARFVPVTDPVTGRPLTVEDTADQPLPPYGLERQRKSHATLRTTRRAA